MCTSSPCSRGTWSRQWVGCSDRFPTSTTSANPPLHTAFRRSHSSPHRRRSPVSPPDAVGTTRPVGTRRADPTSMHGSFDERFVWALTIPSLACCLQYTSSCCLYIYIFPFEMILRYISNIRMNKMRHTYIYRSVPRSLQR